MHCRSCGDAVLPLGQYCSGCGEDAVLKHTNLQLEGAIFPFCKECGNQNEKGSIHCSECGNSLTQYTKKSIAPILKKTIDKVDQEIVKLPTNVSSSLGKLDITATLQSIQPKYILSAFLTTTGALFAIFFVLSLVAKSEVARFIKDTNEELYLFRDMSSTIPDFYDKFLGVPYAFLQSLGASFYLNLPEQMLSTGFRVPMLSLSVLIAVLFYFTGRGIAYSTKTTSVLSHVINSVIVGVLFAVVAVILSFISKENVTVEEVSVRLGMSSSSAMWNAFLLGSLFTFIGSMSYKGDSENNVLSSMTKLAWRTHLYFMAGIYLITLIVLISKDDIGNGINFYLAYVFTLLQWVMVPFGSFTLKMDSSTFDFTRDIQTSISMGTFKEWDGETSGNIATDLIRRAFMGELSFVQAITIIALIVLVLYVAFLGYRQVSQYRPNTEFAAVKLSLLFAIPFSFIAACWMKFIQFGFTAKTEYVANELISLTPNAGKNLLLVFIIITLSHYVGTKIARKQK